MALPHTFSFEDASLLSGIEPLPLSCPPSPHRSSSSSPPSTFFSPSSIRRAASSEVTAQLYASLRRSRELGEDEETEPQSPTSAEQKPVEGSNMTSDVDDLADEMSRRLREGVEASERKEASTYISQMESLRGHLKTMLTLGNAVTVHGDVPDKSQDRHSDGTSSLLSARPAQDLSPPLSLTGLEGLFPRYSTLYNAAPSLPDLQIRDALEKETARRKHLEGHIHNLQNDMLELQQRLSVSLTADRRKDAMIQQLDQTLAMVVGGWKQQEYQREDAVRRLKKEKEEAERAGSKDHKALSQVQRELAEVLESLEREKNTADDRQLELQRQVEEQAARVAQLEAEREAEEEVRAEERREMDSLQYRMQEQQKTWEEREREVQEECRRVQEEGRTELEKEKAACQQEVEKCQQLQLAASSLQSDVLRLERELQTSHRETDALLMELNLEKARYESEKVRLESEHKIRLEEEITERLTAFHEESAQHLCSAREQHRKQLLDLSSQHEAELSNQLSQFKTEFQERERRHRDIIMDYEHKLSRSEEHCQDLSRSLNRLEIERAEMLTQLQDVMKSHWSQALRVLSSKAPSSGPSPFMLCQQMEATEQWSSNQTREGGYGEETSDKTRQGVMRSSHLTSSNNGHSKAGDSHFVLNNSQLLEDGNKTSQRSASSRHLKESVGSDLINFSQLLNERSQDPIGGSDDKEPSLRHMGDGSQFCNKAKVDKSSGQLLVGVSQPKEVNIGQLGKSLETTVATNTRSLLNSGHSESRRQDTSQHNYKDLLKSNVAIELSRRQLFDDYVKELSSQSMKVGSLDLDHRQITDINITGSGQPRDFSGHSGQSWLYQALLDHHPPTMGRTSLNETGISQFRDAGGHSFISGHGQPSMLKDSASSQNHGSHVQSQLFGEGRHLKELSDFMSHMAQAQTTLTTPYSSPMYKHNTFGPNQEMRIHPDHREQSSRRLQPSHRMTDPEESFYPMQMEELSQSFSSHHGFFPLEPLQDRTLSATVTTTLPHTSPEHPFQEEPPLNVTELPPNRRAGDEQTNHNPLLQYYIRMLLDRTPGDPLNESEKEKFHENPDVTEIRQYVKVKGNQPTARSEEKEPNVPKPQVTTRKPAVKKEILSNSRRQNATKPLKRVSARGERTGIWK
ncbi:centrobin [Mantella aurantiaca]